MRKMILLLMIFLIISCNSEYSQKNEVSADKMKNISVNFNKENEILNSSINSIEAITLSKFQEYFDLVNLLKEYPEFREAVEIQLAKFSPDTILKLHYPENFTIDHIRIDDVKATSDSTDKIKILYEVVTNNKRFKDSINATVIKNRLIIDDRETVSTKIIFSD